MVESGEKLSNSVFNNKFDISTNRISNKNVTFFQKANANKSTHNPAQTHRQSQQVKNLFLARTIKYRQKNLVESKKKRIFARSKYRDQFELNINSGL